MIEAGHSSHRERTRERPQSSFLTHLKTRDLIGELPIAQLRFSFVRRIALPPLSTTIVILFLFIASAFTAATLAHFTGSDARVAQEIALAVPTLFLAVIYASFRWHHFLLRAAGKATSVAMGFLNFAFLAALFCWPTAWVATGTGLTLDREWLAWTLLGGSQLMALYGLVNGARLHVTKYTIHLHNLPSSWQGQDVVLVSDIHVGVIRGPEFVRRIVARLRELAPKAVFVPGDMFDGAKVDIARTVEPWTDFRPPSGTYFVTGNHDEFGDPTPYLDALTAAGVRVLDNEKIVVDGLQIVGVHNSNSHRSATYRELLERAQIDSSQPSILLLHRPAHLEIAEKAGISLQLSGHTHAGQFPLWTFLVRQIYGRFTYGLNRLDSLQIVTSSGAGSGGPPFRVGTRSEIVVLRLETSDAMAAGPSGALTQKRAQVESSKA